MPGYGTLDADEGTGLLPWSWAERRLRESHDYWLATELPGGRPHVMPVWAVWAEDAAWFSSSGRSRKARNLVANPRAVITTDNPREPVVVHGSTLRVREESALERFTGWVNLKYGTDIPVAFFAENACFRLTPTSAFGLDQSDFTGSPTCWEFPSPA